MRLPFNATCGDVASWRNDQTDWKQAFAKFINFSSLNHLGGAQKKLGVQCPRMSPRGYGPVFKAATITVNIQFYSVRLQKVSRGWPVQAVARLEICTMRIHIVLYYCTLFLTSSSNPVTRPIGHFGRLLLLYSLFC